MIPRFVRRLYRRFYPARPTLAWWRDGARYAAGLSPTATGLPPATSPEEANPLEVFFEGRIEGRGIWKWRHYFDIYHRHLNPLRHRDLVVLEIGVYSGGSLDMWRDYFGPSASIYGVDVEPACRAHERPGTRILIGDQADRAFWQRSLADGTLPHPDVVIDDGGHEPNQQRVTLEELLPHVRAGGVYICEDIHGRKNAFASFVSGLCDELNATDGLTSNASDPQRRLVAATNGVQATVRSVHLYPFVVVIEKRATALPELVAPKHGSQWESFLM